MKEQWIIQGWTVDDTVYPWVAYKGPRFQPTEWKNIPTDQECQLREELTKYHLFCRNLMNMHGSHTFESIGKEAIKLLCQMDQK